MSTAPKDMVNDASNEDDFEIVEHQDGGYVNYIAAEGQWEAKMAEDLGDEWDVVAIKVPGGYKLDDPVTTAEKPKSIATKLPQPLAVPKSINSTQAMPTKLPNAPAASAKSAMLPTGPLYANGGLLPFNYDVATANLAQRQAHLERLSDIRIPRPMTGLPVQIRYPNRRELTPDEVMAIGNGVVKRAWAKAFQEKGMPMFVKYRQIAWNQAERYKKLGHINGAMVDIE